MSSSNGGSDTGYSSGEENEAKAKIEEDRPPNVKKFYLASHYTKGENAKS